MTVLLNSGVLPTDPVLADTNILLRLTDSTATAHDMIVNALAVLAAAGLPLHVTPQNLTEFWNVATRPLSRNGFGLSPVEASTRVHRLLMDFVLLPDIPQIFPAWLRLAESVGVSGVQVHDARPAACMAVHNVPNLLTLNGSDFARFAAPGVVMASGLRILDPATI